MTVGFSTPEREAAVRFACCVFVFIVLYALVLSAEPTAGQVATSTPARPAAIENDVLVFTSFRGNGEDGLHLAASDDGFSWRPLNGNRPVVAPRVGPKPLMRDPCIARGPDGRFHMVWTTSWTRPPLVGYATSRDLRHWSAQRGLSLMDDEPDVRNMWAPELFYDEQNDGFILMWASTIPGRFPESDATGDDGYNHRMYYTVTRDFKTFEPTRLLFDDGFNAIDATLIRVDGTLAANPAEHNDAKKRSSARYCLITKDETLAPVRKHLRLAFSNSPCGPWKDFSEPFTIAWVEGPSAIRIGEYWYVYFDHYTDPHYYGGVRSKNLRDWEDVSERMRFPADHRHGTVLRVPRGIVDAFER